MFDFTDNDVLAIYQQLKDRYDLVLTRTSLLDEGFTVWHPYSIDAAAEDVAEFMDGKSDYLLDKLPQA